MNIRTSKIRFYISAGALLASIPAAYGESTADEKWQFEITPYLWAAGVDGTTRLGPLSVDSSSSFSDLLSNLDIGATAVLEARKGRWGVLFDGMYFKFSDFKGNVDLKLTQQMYSLGGAWRALEGRTPVDLIAGLRYNYLKPTLETPIGSRSNKADALDPFVGVRGQMPLAERWTLVGYADAGTFKGGDYAWQLLAGVNYAFSDTMIGKFGYRRYKISYSKDDFEFDNAMHGIYFGVGFRF